MKLRTAYGYNYLGKYDSQHYVPEGTVLPDGFTYEPRPLDVVIGMVEVFNKQTQKWEIVEDDYHEIQKHVNHFDPNVIESHEERTARLKSLGVPDFERIHKERDENHHSLVRAARAKAAEHQKKVG